MGSPPPPNQACREIEPELPQTPTWPDLLRASLYGRLEELVDAALQDLPERIRRGRTFQLYISLVNVLAAAARAGHGLSEAQLHNYVDTWVGMLTAPVSYETRALIADDD